MKKKTNRKEWIETYLFCNYEESKSLETWLIELIGVRNFIHTRDGYIPDYALDHENLTRKYMNLVKLKNEEDMTLFTLRWGHLVFT